MVDVEMQKLMDSIDGFFEKKEVELESKMHITKLLSEQYWAEMVDDESEEEEDFPEEEVVTTDDELDGVDEEDEVEDLEVPDTIPELEVPKPPLQRKGKVMMPKPKIKR